MRDRNRVGAGGRTGDKGDAGRLEDGGGDGPARHAVADGAVQLPQQFRLPHLRATHHAREGG